MSCLMPRTHPMIAGHEQIAVALGLLALLGVDHVLNSRADRQSVLSQHCAGHNSKKSSPHNCGDDNGEKTPVSECGRDRAAQRAN